MNPFTIPLFVVPAAITIYASLVKRRWIRFGLLLVASAVFWFVLPMHVHWTFSHPFNPNDGGPKAFAIVFGWLIGLVLVVTPVYWTSRVIQWIWSKIRG